MLWIKKECNFKAILILTLIAFLCATNDLYAGASLRPPMGQEAVYDALSALNSHSPGKAKVTLEIPGTLSAKNRLKKFERFIEREQTIIEPLKNISSEDLMGALEVYLGHAFNSLVDRIDEESPDYTGTISLEAEEKDGYFTFIITHSGFDQKEGKERNAESKKYYTPNHLSNPAAFSLEKEYITKELEGGLQRESLQDSQGVRYAIKIPKQNFPYSDKDYTLSIDRGRLELKYIGLPIPDEIGTEDGRKIAMQDVKSLAELFLDENDLSEILKKAPDIELTLNKVESLGERTERYIFELFSKANDPEIKPEKVKEDFIKWFKGKDKISQRNVKTEMGFRKLITLGKKNYWKGVEPFFNFTLDQSERRFVNKEDLKIALLISNMSDYALIRNLRLLLSQGDRDALLYMKRLNFFSGRRIFRHDLNGKIGIAYNQIALIVEGSRFEKEYGIKEESMTPFSFTKDIRFCFLYAEFIYRYQNKDERIKSSYFFLHNLAKETGATIVGAIMSGHEEFIDEAEELFRKCEDFKAGNFIESLSLKPKEEKSLKALLKSFDSIQENL